ncbi:hypothetical protein OGAPHI_004522 [Ogataea philodendri]|uniref:Uncharacterized protein n=1 Tax=Ogataea philodendri TaxID=1378263 RepID=A0A9P8T4U9_9ASCO|nr:uncharacterized protein OGAPHI_004522 [Ogataea philodendri]KAH3666333.1 hypothetical protein OGAPHI_004522 [Ogataea philodendri]
MSGFWALDSSILTSSSSEMIPFILTQSRPLKNTPSGSFSLLSSLNKVRSSPNHSSILSLNPIISPSFLKLLAPVPIKFLAQCGLPPAASIVSSKMAYHLPIGTNEKNGLYIVALM